MTRCFPIIKSTPRSSEGTRSRAFKTGLFSELPQFGRKLTQCSFIYCACWIKGLNGRRSFLLQSEILRKVSSIIFFFSRRDASLPLWTMIEREMQAESGTSKMRSRTYRRCQGQSFRLGVRNDRQRSVSPRHPASPITTWYNVEAGGWEGAGCHSPVGLVVCCLMPTAFSYGNVWLSSWKMAKYFAKLSPQRNPSLKL